MKKTLFCLMAIAAVGCNKNDWTCHCTMSTTTKTGSQSSTTNFTSTIKVKKTTKTRAQEGDCANTETTETFTNSTVVTTKDCTVS